MKGAVTGIGVLGDGLGYQLVANADRGLRLRGGGVERQPGLMTGAKDLACGLLRAQGNPGRATATVASALGFSSRQADRLEELFGEEVQTEAERLLVRAGKAHAFDAVAAALDMAQGTRRHPRERPVHVPL